MLELNFQYWLYSYLNLKSRKIGIASLIVALYCNTLLSLFPYVIFLQSLLIFTIISYTKYK